MRLPVRFLAILFLLPMLFSCNWQTGRQVKEGLDLSHHNTVTDWKAVKADFIYIKATEGANYKDPKWHSYSLNAAAAGIPVGAYHFLTTSSSAEDQFKNFSSSVPKGSIQLIPALDIEKQTPGAILPRKELQQLVRRWVTLCDEHYGRKPVIYCSQAFWLKNFAGVFSDCPFWCGDPGETEAYVSFTDWSIWQYKVSHVPGIKGKVDLNRLSAYHSLEELML
ncbi:MAG: hypothetical protein J5764_02395 [Bacteroidales bacterium]|nr:hypothetical protein [Bacteroidales bacterium]